VDIIGGDNTSFALPHGQRQGYQPSGPARPESGLRKRCSPPCVDQSAPLSLPLHLSRALCIAHLRVRLPCSTIPDQHTHWNACLVASGSCLRTAKIAAQRVLDMLACSTLCSFSSSSLPALRHDALLVHARARNVSSARSGEVEIMGGITGGASTLKRAATGDDAEQGLLYPSASLATQHQGTGQEGEGEEEEDDREDEGEWDDEEGRLMMCAEEEEGDIIVPDMHNNVPEAVLLAHDKAYGTDSILLRSGEHSWTSYNHGRIEVLRSLRVKVERGGVLLGRWLLLRGSSGRMEHARCLSQTPSSQTIRCFYDPTIFWQGARDWRLVNCDIRSAGSVAALASQESQVVLVRCSLGGALQRRYREDFDELYCASEALTVLGEARITAHRCSFEDSFGPGCSLMGASVCRIRMCLFTRTAIGTVFDWDCRSRPFS
jgi:hypothetical protein